MALLEGCFREGPQCHAYRDAEPVLHGKKDPERANVPARR